MGPAVGAERGIEQSSATAGTGEPLFPSNELESLRTRKEVQTAFVDEPRKAVEQADGLVASALKRMAEEFSDERPRLEQQGDRGDSVSTEELREALQTYRAFFDRFAIGLSEKLLTAKVAKEGRRGR